MATAPSTTAYFTAPIPTSASTYPHPPCGGYYPPPIPYPSSIQIHDGYYPPPPYLAGYGSSPPTFPNPHPTSTYAPPPALERPLAFHYPPAPAPPANHPQDLWSTPSTPSEHTSFAPISDSLLPSASINTTLPLNSASVLANPRVFADKTSGSAPTGRIATEPYANEAPHTTENSRALYTGEKGAGNSGSVLPPATPDFTYQGRDLTKGNSAGGASLSDEKFVCKHRGPGILAMANNDSNHSFVTHLAQSQSSFDSLRGELSKLSTLVSQFAVEMGVQTTKPSVTGSCSAVASAQFTSPASLFSNTSVAQSSSTCYLSPTFGPSFVVPTPTLTSVSVTSASTLPSATANVAPHVFGEMPAQKSWQETHGTAPNYWPGHYNPIQSSCVSNISEQNLEMPQSYGFSNLDRQSVCLADGTEHSYFTLPANYPLERDIPKPVFDVYADDTEGCSSKSVDVLAGTLGQQSHEEEQKEGDQILRCLSKRQDDERSSNCPVLKTTDSCITRSSQLSIVHIVRELRLLWDPGASTSPSPSKAVILERRKEWDPGDLRVSTSTGENVGITASQFAAAQTAALALVYYSKTNNTVGYETMLVHNLLLPMSVQKFHNETMQSHVPAKEKQESEQLDKCLHKASLTASHEQVGSWKQPCENLGSDSAAWRNLSVGTGTCYNWDPGIKSILVVYKQSHNTVSEEAAEFIFQHHPVIHADRSIILTNEKSTRAASILFVQEAIVHHHDEYQLPLSSAPSIWDPGINLFSYKKLYLVPWIPHSAINILQQLHNQNICSMWNLSFEKVRKLQWDPGIKLLLYELFCLQTLSNGTEYAMRHLLSVKFRTHNSTYLCDTADAMYVSLEKEKLVQWDTCSMFSAGHILPRNPWYVTFPLHQSLWEFSISGLNSVQWDPGVPLSLYGQLNILAIWNAVVKPFSCTYIPELATWQHQATSASYVWDPGTIFLLSKFICLFLFPQEKQVVTLIPQKRSFLFNAMQYCQKFQKCNALNCQEYSHQDLDLYGIHLWLISFHPP